MMELTFAELFCGIGCFRLGLEQAGWRCVWANDWEKATKTKNRSGDIYRYHWNDGTYHDGDIREVDARQIPDHTLLTAGFPCQSFSIAGKRKGISENRGTLFTHIARVAEVKRPKFLLLENVGGLLNHDSGRTFAIILRVLGNLGYLLEWQLLNSRYFGVPQNRNRVYIVGCLGAKPCKQVFPIGEDAWSNASPYGKTQSEGKRLRSENNRDFASAISGQSGGNKGQFIQVANTISARYGKDGSENLIQVNKNETGECTRIYDPLGNSPTLNANTGGHHIPKIVVKKPMRPCTGCPKYDSNVCSAKYCPIGLWG